MGRKKTMRCRPPPDKRKGAKHARGSALSHPVIVLGEDFTVRLNNSFRRQFGLRPGDGVGRPAADLVPGRGSFGVLDRCPGARPSHR
jgi:hypothetical protein